MKKVDLSVDKIDQFEGFWIVIDPVKNKITAVGKSLDEVSSLVTRPETDKRPSGTVPYSYLVPRKGEGPYILYFK